MLLCRGKYYWAAWGLRLILIVFYSHMSWYVPTKTGMMSTRRNLKSLGTSQKVNVLLVAFGQVREGTLGCTFCPLLNLSQKIEGKLWDSFSSFHNSVYNHSSVLEVSSRTAHCGQPPIKWSVSAYDPHMAFACLTPGDCNLKTIKTTQGSYANCLKWQEGKTLPATREGL